MVRLLILVAAVALVLLILALIGSLSAERVHALPRALWVLIVVLVPLAGPIAYFLWGRPVDRTARRPAARPSSPDDDPEFLRSMNTEQSRRDRELLAQWERELRRDEEPPAPPAHDDKPQARDEDRG
ncbi:PLD nuclease N-terminal domain-containing protein [Actinoplanes sp. NPDC020271]|uniref:PLD nuclease N-terminal domain-containing protein n=1 Tax=Actinoplanes sp. NPDC020271 TaxID=3363896 RepID=UPI0037ADDAD3